MTTISDRLAPSGRNFHQYSVQVTAKWLAARDERYQEYRRLWTDRPRTRQPGDFPLHVDIETTNHCNLKCPMCPRTKFLERKDWRWSPRGLGFMSFTLYRSLIGQAADGGAYSVKLNLLGEPLVHPDIFKQVAYAHEQGLYVMMNTNAALLTPEASSRLLEAGLDDIFFSLDAPRRDDYHRLRPGAQFELVLKNISDFVEIKNAAGMTHVQTRATMVTDVLGPTSGETKEQYRQLAANLGVEEVGFGPEDDHLTDYSDRNMTISADFCCEQIYQRMFVTWDGQIMPCCGHWEREYPIGSIEETTLKAAWHNSAYRHLRQAHETGQFRSVSICRRCSVPWLAHRLEDRGN